MLTKILKAIPSLSAPAFFWQEVLGSEDYVPFESKWLIQTEHSIKSHHCRVCGESHQVVYHSKSDIVSVPPSDSHCERSPLGAEDVRIHEFDLTAMGRTLCRAFGITEELTVIGRGAALRLGWIGLAQNQYPVYMLLKNPSAAPEAARHLLLEEDRPFALFSGTHIPALYPSFKKKKCALFSLERIVELTTNGLSTIMTGTELFSGFLRDASGSVYVPSPDVQIIKDYARIKFSDGYEICLSRAPIRRSMVRFIHEWVQQKDDPAFDIEVLRDAHNEKYPNRQWVGERFKEDLFKRHEPDFDRLFSILDNAGGRFLIKI